MRWPFGLAVAGLKKTDVIREFISRNYPYTRVRAEERRIGAVRPAAPNERTDQQIVEDITAGPSLIYDATAEHGVQYFLADWAREKKIPYVAVDGTLGGWGGKIVRIIPGVTEGCWVCAQCAFTEKDIPLPPAQPEANGMVQPVGCGDPTFTGTSFDLGQVALTAVRTAVATLCRDAAGGYPSANWDVMTVALRDTKGQLIPPQFCAYTLKKHPACPRCKGSA